MCLRWRPLFLLLVVFAAGAATAKAQETPVQEPNEPEWRWGPLTGGGDLAITSAYVWRGFVLHDGACFQPDVWLAVSDFTVTWWLNVRHRVPDDSHFNEHDLTIDYSRGVGRMRLSAGWTNYRFLGLESGNTNEFYAGAKADVLLQPGLTVYKDVGQGTGTYVSISAGHEVPAGTRAAVGGQVAFGYNDHLYIDTAGWSDVAVTLSASLAVRSARLVLKPTLTYSRSLMPETFPSRLFGGLSVAFK